MLYILQTTCSATNDVFGGGQYQLSFTPPEYVVLAVLGVVASGASTTYNTALLPSTLGCNCERSERLQPNVGGSLLLSTIIHFRHIFDNGKLSLLAARAWNHPPLSSVGWWNARVSDWPYDPFPFLTRPAFIQVRKVAHPRKGALAD